MDDGATHMNKGSSLCVSSIINTQLSCVRVVVETTLVYVSELMIKSNLHMHFLPNMVSCYKLHNMI